MTINEYWDTSFTSSEKLLFQKCCRVLLKKTFIVRDKDDENRKMYYFISKNTDFFSSYFGFMSFDIIVSKDAGIVMLQNDCNNNDDAKLTVNKVQLKRVESIVLCCLWTLFADRIQSGSLSKQISITMTELRFELEKYDFKEVIDKSTMQNILNLFVKFNLISTKGDIGNDDFCIILYPSLQFALNENEFALFAKTVQERMMNQPIETQPDESEGTEDDIDGEDNL